MKRVLLCLILSGTAGFALAQGGEQGTIRGVVLQAGTEQPIAGAQVTLFAAPVPPSPGTPGVAVGGAVGGGIDGLSVILGGGAVPPPPPQGVLVGAAGRTTVATDGSGRFAFAGLEAGAYRVTAAAAGFVTQEHGQVAFYAPGSPIILTGPESAADVELALSRTGTISGQVLDESGQLAISVPVQVLRVSYASTGERRVQAVGAGQSDDRGLYRVFGLTPGRYYLSAGTPPGPVRRIGGLGGPIATSNSDMLYGVTYYPGVTDLSRAGMLDVPAGGEVVSDLVVKRSQLYRVRGRIVDPVNGVLPARVNVSLSYTNLTGGGGSFSSGLQYDPSTGAFELQNVIPGDYTLSARVQPAPAGRPDPADPETLQSRALETALQPAAELPIQVVNADVEGIVLTLTPPVDVSGRIRSERESAIPGVEGIRVRLRPVAGVNAPRPQDTGPDGSFVIQAVRPGDYAASLLGIPAGFYLRELRYANANVLGQSFEVSASRQGALDVILAAGAEEVRGSVTSEALQGVPGAQVVFVPAERDRVDLYRNAMTDQNGRFTIPNVAPGDYAVFGWEALEPYSYFDPAVLSRYEALGTPVTVGLGAPSVDLRIIPVD